TLNKHIAPLVFRYCSACHRPGEAAPFPLLTYEDVRKHGAQIVAVTQRRYMPPWLPERGFGDFVGESRLTDAQLRLISDWVAQGCAEGDRADLPSPPQFTEGWAMGPPDLVVRIPKAYRLAASGTDVFRNFIVPMTVQE